MWLSLWLSSSCLRMSVQCSVFSVQLHAAQPVAEQLVFFVFGGRASRPSVASRATRVSRARRAGPVLRVQISVFSRNWLSRRWSNQWFLLNEQPTTRHRTPLTGQTNHRSPKSPHNLLSTNHCRGGRASRPSSIKQLTSSGPSGPPQTNNQQPTTNNCGQHQLRTSPGTAFRRARA
jgi:hypothetical protein